MSTDNKTSLPVFINIYYDQDSCIHFQSFNDFNLHDKKLLKSVNGFSSCVLLELNDPDIKIRLIKKSLIKS